MIYSNINKNENIVNKKKMVQVKNHFLDGGFIEVISPFKKKFLVEFWNVKGECEFRTNISSNSWAKTNKKYFEEYTCKVYDDNNLVYNETYNAKGKRVYIALESKSLGDTLAWVPYVDEFRKKWDCEMVCSTFWNYLFEKQYPNIKFVKPGEAVDGLYAMYKLGLFITNNEFDLNRNNYVPNSQPLQKVATDILGLEYKEIKPKIKKFNPFKSKKPYITIATHSTAQTKYWNNPTGWQELVDYVKSKGYDVYLLSKEEDGYMGNKNPEGVIQIQNKSLEEIGSLLLGSECFVGISSGLSWYAWALEVPSILISGFTNENLEMKTDVVRIINKDVCNGCWAKHMFDKGDWNWCPEHKGTERQFECTKSITFNMVERHLEEIIKNNED